MAKRKRVPLNRLVTQETFDSVKNLAVVLECSEGEVIDQAVVLFESSMGGQDGGRFAREPEAVDGVVMDDPVDGLTARERALVAMASASGGVVTSFLGADESQCRHCSQVFKRPLDKPSSICDECPRKGHQKYGDCRQCAIEVEVAKRQAESSACDTSEIDFNQNWGA